MIADYGLIEDQTDLTQIWLIFTMFTMFSEQLDGSPRLRIF